MFSLPHALKLSCILLLLPLAAGRDFTYFSLDGEIYPQARCNDGSIPGLYVSGQTQTSPSSILIYLESGGWCYSSETCAQRNQTSPSLMSSKSWKSSITKGGIFDSQIPILNDALQVSIPYCTSDGHMGNADDTANSGWEFRGDAVIKAALDTVMNTFDLSGTTLVIFGGASAGARGAMVHLDYASSLFSSKTRVVKGILDSPLWVDLPPPQPELKLGLLKQTALVHDLAGVSGVDVLGAECMSAHYGEDEYKCMFGEYRLPTVQTEHLLISAQFDSYQIGQDLTASCMPFHTKFCTQFGDKMRQVFEGLIEGNKGNNNYYYSQPCFNHAISEGGSYFTSCTDDGVSLDDAVRKFLDGTDENRDLTDYCAKGFVRCTNGGKYCPQNDSSQEVSDCSEVNDGQQVFSSGERKC